MLARLLLEIYENANMVGVSQYGGLNKGCPYIWRSKSLGATGELHSRLAIHEAASRNKAVMLLLHTPPPCYWETPTVLKIV